MKADLNDGILLVRIDLVLQYVQRMNLQEHFTLATLDDKILAIESQLNYTVTYDMMGMDCQGSVELEQYETNLVPRHIIEQMRYDS